MTAASPRPWTKTALRIGLLIGAGALGLGVACIIPDEDIQVLITDINANPVRFIDAIPLDESAACACSEDCECPMPDPTGLPTFLDPQDPAYQFCVCGENRIDEGRLYGTFLFVEDQDDVDGRQDELFAAALLDWDPTSGDSAFDYVAYRNYLDPRTPLDLYFSSYEKGVIKRPRPFVRSITLQDVNGRFDLCNDAGRPVAPGFHTLSLIVTDRPWFTRDPGAVETDGGDEGPDLMAATLDGVPDIAAGATYDVQTYVFFCQQEGDATCGCVEPS